MVCVSECSPGFYGVDCDNRCDCEHSLQCDRVTGQCQCKVGFTGDRCDQGKTHYLLLSPFNGNSVDLKFLILFIKTFN